MGAADRWLEFIDTIFDGEDDAQLYERALRARGDVDKLVLAYLTYRELRAIRRLLEGRS